MEVSPSRLRQTRMVSIVVLVMVAMTLVACDGKEVAVKEDQSFNGALKAMQPGDRIPLRKLIPAQWAEVWVYRTESSTREMIENEVGRELDMAEAYIADGCVMVFMRNGQIAYTLLTFDANFSPGRYTQKTVVYHGFSQKDLKLIDK